MGYYSSLYNKVVEVLKAKKAEGQPLAYLKGFYFGNDSEQTAKADPWVRIRMDDPASEERWGSTGDVHYGEFRVVVDCVSRSAKNDFPYGFDDGDPTHRKHGVLTLVEDVMNVLDLARAELIAAAPRCPDMDVSMRRGLVPGQLPDSALNAVEVVLRFMTRVRAGAR